MTHHQTQNEHAQPTSRRALAPGSSLLAVMILLSMLPPTAGLTAMSVLGDDPVAITLRDSGTTPRREARSTRVLVRVPLHTPERTPLASAAPRSLLSIAAQTTPALPVNAAGPSRPASIAWVRDALLSLPPPRA